MRLFNFGEYEFCSNILMDASRRERNRQVSRKKKSAILAFRYELRIKSSSSNIIPELGGMGIQD